MIRVVRKIFLIGGSVIVVLVLITLIVAIIIQNGRSHPQLNEFSSKSILGIFKEAAVSSNGPECSKIGVDMMRRNGSAVDAAIATLLCEGIASLHSMGLGGGFLMTIYDASEKTVEFLDARETAPGEAYANMYDGVPSLSLYGGLSVAIPGELLGYWEAHQKYGKLPWKELFKPSIELCKTGSIVTSYLEKSLKQQEDFIRAEPTMSEILINPRNNKLYQRGERIKRPTLAKTLSLLANSDDPVNLFYKGEIMANLTRELHNFGAIINENDFATYKIKWKKPIEVKLGNLTVYSAPPPGSGVLVAFMINVLENILPKNESIMYQRLVEAFKWAYAKRTELGDPDYVNLDSLIETLISKEFAETIKLDIAKNKTYNDPKHYGAVTTNKEDHGTAHISVIAPDGSAVSVTSTINQVLGAKIRSKSTGIIFNDEMDDFSSPNITNGFNLPPSESNYIEPYKRPMSSMSPTIVLDENKNVRLVIGAAGGSKITTAVVTVMVLNFWRNKNIKEAIDSYRIHHQLLPMTIQNEKGFNCHILRYLKKIGHNSTIYSGIGSAVTAIEKENGEIFANSDYRREGLVAGF